MARKAKMTGFARLFIFIIIAAPLLYTAVTFIKGEDIKKSIKRDFGIEIGAISLPSFEKDSENLSLSEYDELKAENEALKARLEALEKNN